MILNERTEEEFGYKVDLLTEMSSKKIICRCDFCNQKYESTPKRIKIGRKVINKDACIKCKFIKREAVSLKRDGVKNSACRKDVKKKIKESNNKKYGKDYYVQTEEFKEKAQAANLEKYGAKHILQTTKFQKIARQTKIKNGNLTEYRGKLASEWAVEKGYSKVRFQELVKIYGFEKATTMTPQQSSLETLFEEMLKSENIKYEKQFKVQNRYADFFIEDKVLVECDGLYWHSDKVLDDNYHFDKKQLYVKEGYDSLFFREDELNNKMDICKSILFNKLGWNNKIGARKCSIRQVSKKESGEFFNTNHLMGVGRGDSVGLYHNEELVCCIRYVKIKDGYDISRFCCKNFTSVVGGFSRLEKWFIEWCEPEYIRNFVDMRYGTGAHLKFKHYILSSCHKSFSWTNFIETFHRMKFPSNSGYNNGLAKIWDCGQSKFIKTL